MNRVRAHARFINPFNHLSRTCILVLKISSLKFEFDDCVLYNVYMSLSQ
jgi:hypothetical protein